jgi:hypothetical protein
VPLIERSLLLAFRLQFSPFCHVYHRCTNPFQVPRRVRQGRRRVDDAGRICSVCVQRRLFRGIIFPRTAVRSFATRKRLLPRVSNAPPTQPHCDPRRPSCMATSGCCCSFVAQRRRRRKTGSRKMAGSKTIIRSRRPPIENESERCVTKRAKPSIDRSTGTGYYCTTTLLKCLSYSPTTTTTTTTQRSSDKRLNYAISIPYCPKKRE